MQPPEAPADPVRPTPPTVHVGEIRRSLLEHYDWNRRELPWRGEIDPYRVWVSEVMLQQTRVEAVIPYYRRWMERFPDVNAVALAHEDDVLGLWEGLGYYSRARNLHRAARVIQGRHGGELPRAFSELRQLPGFGNYTAGAVASIAFGAPEPAVDGNARRVLSRVFDLERPSARELTARASELVDPARPGDFNQALMDLGATVCTPRSPRCGACPLRLHCAALANGTVGARPSPRARRPSPERTFAVAVIVDAHQRALLQRRPRRGLLGGLWAFPESEIGEGDVPVETARERAAALGIRSTEGEVLAAVRHAFTHFRATYLPVVFRTENSPGLDDRAFRWVRPCAPALALPAAQKRIMASLEEWLTRVDRPHAESITQ
jgi:A/G-specific adenine glycosylase